jgi:chloramphenicol-sensitive protein RarD
VGVVAAGVAWLVLRGEGFPWVALVLAVSFAGYGLLRKTTPVGALTGLLVETILLAPLAVLYLALHGGGEAPGLGAGTIGLLALAGPVTALPLVLFAYGARRLKLSTLGLMMYINPTVQMLLAVYAYGEPFTSAHAVTFIAIWAGLGLYSWPERRVVAPGSGVT